MTTVSNKLMRRAERISADWRVRLGLRAFDPLPANRLAAHPEFAATIYSWATYPGLSKEAIDGLSDANLSGFVADRDPLLIYYNPHHSPARYESTIMHELAHIMLAHPKEAVRIVNGEAVRTVNRQIEDEADYLGSCLQIPRRGVLWARQRGMDNGAMQAHFGASETMVVWRLNMVKF